MVQVLPARYRRNLVEAAAAGIGMGQPAHVSLKANRFTLVDAAGNQRPLQTLHMDCIIVDANNNVSKIYYDSGYTGDDDGQPPTCWSDNGLAPSSQAAQPQSPTCASCECNKWGSATSQMTGKGVKACRDYKKLAVIIPDDPQTIVYQLRIPPASGKALATYAKSLSAHNLNGRPADLVDAVTRVQFIGQGVIDFSPVAQVSEQQGLLLDQIIDSGASDAVVGRTDTPYQGAIAAPAPVRQIATPQQTFVPQPAAPSQQWAPQQQTIQQDYASRVNPQQQAFQQPTAFGGQPGAPPPAPNGPAPARTPRGRKAASPAPVAAAQPPQGVPVDFSQMPRPQQGAFPTPQPQPQNASFGAPFSDKDIPNFLRRPETAPVNNGFGMQQGAAPPDAMEAALAAAFKV